MSKAFDWLAAPLSKRARQSILQAGPCHINGLRLPPLQSSIAAGHSLTRWQNTRNSQMKAGAFGILLPLTQVPFPPENLETVWKGDAARQLQRVHRI